MADQHGKCPSSCKCSIVQHPRPGGAIRMQPPPQSPNCKHCCDSPDWQNHHELRNVRECEIRAYRQARLQRWLDHMGQRHPQEPFGHFIGRSFALATHELHENTRHLECVGDEWPHFLDRYVWRLWKGANVNFKNHGVNLCENEEQLMLQLLREECDILFRERALVPDPTKFMGPLTKWTHCPGGGGCAH